MIEEQNKMPDVIWAWDGVKMIRPWWPEDFCSDATKYIRADLVDQLTKTPENVTCAAVINAGESMDEKKRAALEGLQALVDLIKVLGAFHGAEEEASNAIRAALSTDQYALGFEAGKKSRDQEVKELVDGLNYYSSEDNWCEDDNGKSRVWLEPDSSTPDAYHGYELARTLIARHTNNQGEK